MEESLCGVEAVATLPHPREISFGVPTVRRHIGRCPRVSIRDGGEGGVTALFHGAGRPSKGSKEVPSTAFHRPPNAPRQGPEVTYMPVWGRQGSAWEGGPRGAWLCCFL